MPGWGATYATVILMAGARQGLAITHRETFPFNTLNRLMADQVRWTAADLRRLRSHTTRHEGGTCVDGATVHAGPLRRR